MTTPFSDLDTFLAIPRLGGLRLSGDGSRLVTTLATLNAKRTQYRTALWQIDPAGELPAKRLTRSRRGESSGLFTDSGDVLFTSPRPDPDGGDHDDVPALWLLPASGGEARVIGSRPGGFGRVQASGSTVLVAAQRLPGAADEAAEASLRRERRDRSVSAMLHTGYPVRHWDSDTGPGATHLLAATLPPDETAGETPSRLALRDVTPWADRHEIAHAELSPDGTFAVVTRTRMGRAGERRDVLERLDLADGGVRTLVDDPDADAEQPVISPDGTRVLFTRSTLPAPSRPPQVELHLLDLTDGTTRRVAKTWDRWRTEAVWLPDGSGLVLTADSDGRRPVFLLDLAGDEVRRVSADDAAFSDLQVSPDGRWVYALRSSLLAPPEVVRIDLRAFRGTDAPVQAQPLHGPRPAPGVPGRLTEVTATAADGTPLRAWLALPEDADAQRPAPLLLWIHGGPLNSWNAWNWRGCPWLMAAQGYAVLLPDPALSTGYGEAFIARGWGRWGAEPYTDLMALTDAALTRPDLDAARTAALGGSFGGYMTNWMAGQTDRFRAIVSHASIWALDQFGPTNDQAHYWERQACATMLAEHSPHAFVERIATPMLVVHGNRDYRVPIGQSLRMWWELLSRSALATDDDGRAPHRFLYFPDENHWISAPQNAAVWHRTVLAFLSEHVLDEPVAYPAVLGG